MKPGMSLSLLFIAQSVRYMKMNLPRIEKCLGLISEEEAWHKTNESTNSIANLILHLNGNITQYILSGLGGAPDARVREAEFAATGGMTKRRLMDRLSFTVAAATRIIAALDEERLQAVYSVQGMQQTGVEIVVHVTEHFSYHTGQIALLVKLMKNTDTGFYAGMDLSRRNG